MRSWFRTDCAGAFAAYLMVVTLSAVAAVNYVVTLPDCDDVASLTQVEPESCRGG